MKHLFVQPYLIVSSMCIAGWRAASRSRRSSGSPSLRHSSPLVTPYIFREQA
jgi:hypothetical protein